MNLDGIFNIMGAIVTVALVSVIVTGKNTSSVISSFGKAFSSSISAAKG